MPDKKQGNEPRKPGNWNREQAQHLLSRAGFGGTPAEVEALRQAGRERAVDHLLRFPETASSESRPAWVREPWVDTEARLPDIPREEQTKRHVATRIRYRQEMDDLRLWWLERMVRTAHPLQEKLVLFWHWHFPTAQAKVFISQAHFVQNALYRTHAAGNFRSLVRAVTVDPGMLLYLDGNTNTAGHPNENYARELMELFTLGIGNYTEQDIREGARALSGWQLDGLTPQFRSEKHDAGEKSFLGRQGTLTWAVVYPEFRFSQNLKLVAQMIGAEFPTRIYYVELPGFDTHATQANRHAALLQELSEGLGSFLHDLHKQGHLNRTLVMTFSEFGRRVAENRSGGTDHGAGSMLFLAGGGVRGGFHGAAPDLDDLQAGDLKHQADFRSIYATVLEQWLGARAEPILGARYPTLQLFRA